MKINSIIGKTDHLYGWLVTSLSGLFMFLTLYVYRAYHIDQLKAFTGHSILFRAIIHSLIISLIFYVVEFRLAPRIHFSQKIKPLITALIATLIGLNITFLAFNYFFHWTELHWISYFQFLYEYPLILVAPVTLSYLIARLVDLQNPQTKELITFTSDNKKEHFKLKPESLLYIKSADNYVEIVHKTAQRIDKHLIRRSLISIEEELSIKHILVRCHRSYLVNPANINHVNHSPSKVELNMDGVKIPVSKKYIEAFTS